MGSALSRIGVPSGVDTYSAALEGLTGVNEVVLGLHPDPPSPYDCGVTYQNRRHNVWRAAHEVAGSGWGDCEDLSAWRAAQLRVTGEDPDARVAVYPTGPKRYHAIVVRGSGDIEDPSAKTGMRIRDRAAYRDRIREAFGNVGIDDGTGDFGGGADYDLRPNQAYVQGDEVTDDVGMLDPRAIRQQHAGAYHRRQAARAAGRTFAAPRAGQATESQMQHAQPSPVYGDECTCGLEHVDGVGPDADFVVGEDSAPGVSQVTFDIVHTPHGFTGIMRMPMANGGAIHTHTSAAKTKKKAADNTAKMAETVSTNLVKSGATSALTDTAKAGAAMLAKSAASAVPGGSAALEIADKLGAGKALKSVGSKLKHLF